MMKKHFLKLVLPILLITITKPAYAADLDVVCYPGDSGECEIQGTPTLFNETNWYPGAENTKEILIENNDEDTCDLMMSLSYDGVLEEGSSPSSFTSQLFTAILKDGSPIIGYEGGEVTGELTLQDLFSGSLYFDALASGSSQIYDWIIKFNPEAGNDFQDASTTFSMNLDFGCQTEEIENGGEDGGGEEDDNIFPEYNPPDEEGDTAGAATQLLAGIGGPFFGGDVEGEEEITPEEAPIVEGVQDDTEVKGEGKCVDPWWWFLVFVAQMAIHTIVHLAIDDDKKSLKLILQILNGALFVLVFWENFCPVWDYIVAGVIGLIFSTLSFIENSDK